MAGPDLIERLLARLDTGNVFGPPAQVGDVTIIPVVEVSSRVAYAIPAGAHAEGDLTSLPGAGGAGGRARPIGFIRVAPDGVQFEATLDIPRLSLAGIILAGWVVFWVTQTIRIVARSRP